MNDLIERFEDDDPSDYKTKGESRNADEDDKTIPIALENSFHEFLEEQLGLLDLKTEREIQIAKQIIGSIDEDGYLRRDPINICDDIMFLQNIHTNEEEVIAILEKIQRFDPPGIGVGRRMKYGTDIFRGSQQRIGIGQFRTYRFSALRCEQGIGLFGS